MDAPSKGLHAISSLLVAFYQRQPVTRPQQRKPGAFLTVLAAMRGSSKGASD